jgi:hypothetical protein
MSLHADLLDQAERIARLDALDGSPRKSTAI